MGTILTSTVIAAIIAAIVSLWTAERRISIENITQERRNWREKVRIMAIDVHDALIRRDKHLLDRLRAEFRLMLNPTDSHDNEILACISLPNEGNELNRAEIFGHCVSALLKHDWERAKFEARPIPLRLCVIIRNTRKWICDRPPTREECKCPDQT